MDDFDPFDPFGKKKREQRYTIAAVAFLTVAVAFGVYKAFIYRDENGCKTGYAMPQGSDICVRGHKP